jgi:4-amino-4-deoxy-L-arabinose transferase-like glycosyltransferase
MIYIPLTDPSEARYAEIARKMLETHNWITPQENYGIPFWAKPPLSMWLSALSMKLFGITVFAARLPQFFLTLTSLGLLSHMCNILYNKDFAIVSITTLACLPFVFVASGVVLTDPSLLFSIVLSFCSFWHCINPHLSHTNLWKWLFFVGIAIGLLSKGPLCCVLIGLPLLMYTASNHYSWSQLWHHLPWIKGTCLTLALALPWYLLAEYQTPGFLNYFIVGEHIKRFLISGWNGDKYGHAHLMPLGTIWLFAFIGLIPWSLKLFRAIIKSPKLGFANLISQITSHDWIAYLFCWSVAPLLFFSFAANIVPSYVLTSLPFAVLLIIKLSCTPTHLIKNTKNQHQSLIRWISCSALLTLVLSYALLFNNVTSNLSQESLIHLYSSMKHPYPSNLYYSFDRFYSAEFYSNGTVKQVTQPDQFILLTKNATQDYLAISSRNIDKIPVAIRSKFKLIKNYGTIMLLEEQM